MLAGADDGPLPDYHGTGPYRLVEWRPAGYALCERFADYVPRAGAANGYGGRKAAYLNGIEFLAVPDEAAQIAGLRAGAFHLGLNLSPAAYEALKPAPGLVAELATAANSDLFVLNWRSPLMGSLTLRQAFRAALDLEAILRAGRGGATLSRLDPALMPPGTPWHIPAGSERADPADPARARALLEAAGYDGSPLRILTTPEYPFMYEEAAVAAAQLEAAGFRVDLQGRDWADVLTRRASAERWDVFTTSHGPVPDPSQLAFIGQISDYPGWWDAPAAVAAATVLLAEPDAALRRPLWQWLQRMVDAQLPIVKIGDAHSISVRSVRVGGWTSLVARGIPFWNLWLNA